MSIVLCVALAACGSDSVAPYSGPSIAGHWCARVGQPPWYIAVTFTQSGQSIGGQAQDNVYNPTNPPPHVSTITGSYFATGTNPVQVTFSDLGGDGRIPLYSTPEGSIGHRKMIMFGSASLSGFELDEDTAATRPECAGRYP